MIEVYSNNVTAGALASIPLDNVAMVKGITATKEGNTISLNTCGVYDVTVSGSVTIPTGGTVTIQLEKDGVLLPSAIATITGTAADVIPFSFPALIPVRFSNTPAPCTSPTNIEVISSVEATYNHIDVKVTKLI